MICKIEESRSISVSQNHPLFGLLTQPGWRYGIYINLLVAGLKVAWPVCCRFFWRKTFISMSSCNLVHALDNTGLHSFATGNWALGETQGLLKVFFAVFFLPLGCEPPSLYTFYNWTWATTSRVGAKHESDMLMLITWTQYCSESLADLRHSFRQWRMEVSKDG